MNEEASMNIYIYQTDEQIYLVYRHKDMLNKNNTCLKL